MFQRPVAFDGKSDNCPWDCRPGYQRRGGVCVICDVGMVQDQWGVTSEGTVSVCRPCAQCLASSQYMASACSAGNDTVCKACSGTVCPVGSYIVSACNATSDIVCKPCAGACSAGYYITTLQCTGRAYVDEVAQGCSRCLGLGQCPGGTYLSSLCSGTEKDINRCLQCSVGLAICVV